MSDTLATYAFLPWLRRGMASEITRPDGGMTGAARADVPITVKLDAAGDPRDVVVPLALYGPGEVAGIDRRVVIRTNPKAGENDAEPNYFPAAEFDQPDFPWRYTPAAANAGKRLRPWLVLAVLTADEIGDEAPPGGDGRLGAVTVTSASALPRLSQSWAWAHTQIEGFDATSESIATVVREQPRRVRSRLLAPRRLRPNTAYRALLVPAFERGRLAGLREALDDTVDGLTPAWTDGASNIRLPIYYDWSFQTGAKGDFEFLARKLSARAVDDAVGVIDMDVAAPDPALPAAASGALGYEGALVSPALQGTPWPAAERAPFVGALAALLNQPAASLASEGGGAIVAPPLWGRWHAARDKLIDDSAAQPRWFHALNSDPRHRVAAGLGAEIVRRNDQQLIAGAWDQVEGVIEANAELRRAQLAREAAAKLHQKHYARFDTDTFLLVTSPLQARFMTSPVTIRETLRRSPIPHGTLDGQLRRVLRPAGAIARRATRALAAPRTSLLARLNSGTLRARPPLKTPTGMMSPDKIAPSVRAVPEETVPAPPARRRLDPTVSALLALALVLIVAAIVLVLAGASALAALAALAAAAALVAAFVAYRAAAGAPPPEPPPGFERERLDGGPLSGAVTPEVVRTAKPPAAYVPAITTAESRNTPTVPPDLKPGSPEARAAVELFREACVDLAAELVAPPRPGPVLVEADLEGLAKTLMTQMDPRQTIPAAITHRLAIADWVTWKFDDPLEPVMAAPEFDMPMYEPLRDYGQGWLMPGIGRIPPDTVTLVVSNQRFIEAYMAGLSHEMARELLYHEYPTDQRGTYFRQFWDVRAAMGPGGAAPEYEKLRDIKRIHEWRSDQGLGVNTGRVPVPPAGNVVFLIKGELLRRYPSTLVYAVKTTLENGRRVLGTAEKFPIFEGRLDPDIVFFGFDLLPDDVRGDPDPTKDQGWYFLLQEQPTEPLFGLDADDGRYGGQPMAWNDLNWASLATDGDALATLGYIDLNAALPDTSHVVPAAGDPPLAWHAEMGQGPAGANGSDLAHITLQRPFRVAIHGSDMLGGPTA